MDNFVEVSFLVIAAFICFLLGMITGFEVVYDEYCYSIEYNESESIDGNMYCIDNNDPTNIFYIEWQE